MSIIVPKEKNGRYVGNELLKPDTKKIETLSAYKPSDEENKVLQNILKDFRNAWTTMPAA